MTYTPEQTAEAIREPRIGDKWKWEYRVPIVRTVTLINVPEDWMQYTYCGHTCSESIGFMRWMFDQPNAVLIHRAEITTGSVQG